MTKLILGHSATGASVERFLEKRGEDFVIYDDKNPLARLPDYDIVIKSPGVSLTHPLCEGKTVINDLDLFAQILPQGARIIGITGSTGKTTLATLVDALFRYNKREVALGGNIGTPVLDLPVLSKDGVYILEMSSFQLETAPILPIDLAIITNIVPNHLDRHGTMEAYTASKMNILNLAKAHLIESDTRKILAYIADMFHLPQESINTVLSQFKGLEHRLEIVAQHNNVIYVNDSKGTTFYSVGFAIERFKDQGEIHLIMGGGIKELSAAYLEPFMPFVEKLYIFGKNKAQMAEMLSPYKKPYGLFETLDDVIHSLALNQNKVSIVLLSPGATSYDLYQNYMERGKHFKALIKPFI